MAVIPDRVVADQVLVGSRQTVLDRIGELVDAGLEHPMLIPASAMASPEAAAFTLESVAWLTRELRAPAQIGEITV